MSALLNCAPMDATTRAAAFELLSSFLCADEHYVASSAAYGDGGAEALERALALFLERPEVGLVWLARSGEVALGACVVCYAISTARGSLVAKLDDVTIREGHRSEGVGTAMLVALTRWLESIHFPRLGFELPPDRALQPASIVPPPAANAPTSPSKKPSEQ